MPEYWSPDVFGQLVTLGKVVLAMILGAIIGMERERAEKPAGLRTHMLVAATAALLVGLADVLAGRFTAEAYSEYLRSDPIRIVEAIVTGVSFLGAGTIFRRQDNAVEGLTTAASILTVSAIGIAVALDQYVLAVGVTTICYVTLRLLNRLEKNIFEDKP